MQRKVTALSAFALLTVAACNDPKTYREPARPARVATNGNDEPTYPVAQEHQDSSNGWLPWLLFGASTAHTEMRHHQSEQKREDDRQHHTVPVLPSTPASYYRRSPSKSAPAPAPTYRRAPPSAPAAPRPSSPPARYTPGPTYRSRPPTYYRAAPASRPAPSRGGR